MAVATHVSRVAKEYAPFGYSIMEEATVRTNNGGGNPGRALVFTADDADVYIEGIYVVNDGAQIVAAAAPNTLVVQVSTAPLGGDRTASPTFTAISGSVTAVGTNWQHGATVSMSVTTPVVASGQGIWLEILPGGTYSVTCNIGVVVRYRRKA
jgi:hypothetical protein